MEAVPLGGIGGLACLGLGEPGFPSRSEWEVRNEPGPGACPFRLFG